MKRASSSCGLFIKKEKAMEENPYQCSSSLAGSTVALCPSVNKIIWKLVFLACIWKNVILHTVSILFKEIKFCCRQMTMWNSPSFSSQISATFCFAVLQFPDAALIETPRTRRRGAQNTLYMCHFAVLHPSRLQKVYHKALEQCSLKCVLGSEEPFVSPEAECFSGWMTKQKEKK